MTKTEADDILAYVAQNIIAPLAFNDKPSSEVLEDLIGDDFNKLCLFVYGMVQTDTEVTQMATELSYIDLLTKLKADVKSDAIPAEEKTEILQSIYRLEVLLWKYSA